jgi:hypothetical protein
VLRQHLEQAQHALDDLDGILLLFAGRHVKTPL